MQRYSLVIVGVGPRGLGVLERLNALFHQLDPDWQLDVHLVDPNEPGQGYHSSQQMDYLLTNTVAAQITMFSDSSVQNAGPVVPGPSLHEWAQQAGYRQVAGRCVKTPSDGRPVDANDYLPRALLGEYLEFVFDRIVSTLHPALSLRHHRLEAEGIQRLPDERLRLELERGFTIDADFAVVTTGHGRNRPGAEARQWAAAVARSASRNPKLRFIDQAYPLAEVQTISRDAVVGVQGIGLCAYDIIACLTEGRGGRFLPGADGRLAYRATGREPRIVVFSRQGLPFTSRGRNEKGISGQVQPRFFTRAFIDRLRRTARQRGHGALDFERELWPVLLKEMCLAHHRARAGHALSVPDDYEPDPVDRAAVERILSPLDEAALCDHAGFEAAVRRYVEQDLADALQGNVSNPVKAATDVLRDLRDNIRYAVDYGGLLPSSHARFLERFCAVMNRIAVGPPLLRNQQLLALMDAGIVRLGPGPAPEVSFDAAAAQFKLSATRLAQPVTLHLDVLVQAKLDSFLPEQDASVFVARALHHGVVRPYRNGDYHPGGIEVDRAQNVVDAQGRSQRNLWALGNIAEGPNFYTYVLPRPMVNSRFIQDAGRCMLALIEQVQARLPLETSRASLSA